MFFRGKINSLVLWQQSRLTEWPQSVSVSVPVRLHQALVLLNSAVDVDLIFLKQQNQQLQRKERRCNPTVHCSKKQKNPKHQTYHAESVKQTYRTQRKQAGSGDNSAAGVTRIILFSYETITLPCFPSLNITFQCNINIPLMSTLLCSL